MTVPISAEHLRTAGGPRLTGMLRKPVICEVLGRRQLKQAVTEHGSSERLDVRRYRIREDRLRATSCLIPALKNANKPATANLICDVLDLLCYPIIVAL